ncbi:unnamed protein product [Caenorhabditis brenneri]
MRRSGAPGSDGPANKKRPPVRKQNSLEELFNRALSSIESKARGNDAFAPLEARIRDLKTQYLSTPFDATPRNCIGLKKKMFSTEGVTDEMKKIIEEVRVGVDDLVEEMVKSAGHCCSIEKKHALHNLQCAADPECRIIPGELYRILLDENKEESTDFYCLKKLDGNILSHYDRYKKRHRHAEFSDKVAKTEHQPSDVEEWLECIKCRTHHHATCTKYHPAKDGKQFICSRCDPSKITICRAEELDTTKATEFFERELNYAFPELKILCRILSAVQKYGDHFQKHQETEFPYLGKLPPVPYIKKTYGFFVERDGVDVLFFTLVTHEYKNVASRKNNTIHLEYLDSVKYVDCQFRAKVHISVFQTLCSYARDAGFESIHFWACPPYENDDYVLNAHPQPARKATFKELFGWYDKAAVCEAVEQVIRGYYKKTNDETINELLDAVCYENYLITAELERTLGKHEALSDEEKMKKLEILLKKYRANMYSIKLKKADQGEVQDYPEILFPGSFALSDTFVAKQRAHKLEFHTIQSAKYATQIIIFSVKWERRIGELQTLIEPIAESPPSTPATIPNSAPLPAMAQVLNPMNTSPAIPPSSEAAAIPQMALPQVPPRLAQVGNPNVIQMNAPPPQLSASLQLQTGLPPLPPAAAAVLQQIRWQMLQSFYSYTSALTNAPAPQPALPQTPHRAAAALQEPIRLQLAQDYYRLGLELMNVHAPTHQPQIPPALNRVHLQQTLNPNQLALSDVILPQRPTSATEATPPPTPPVVPQLQ